MNPGPTSARLQTEHRLIVEAPIFLGELSEREFQILQLIAEGQMNKEIARSLAISAETVKWHIKNIYAKLKVNSRTQAMSRALEMKLLD